MKIFTRYRKVWPWVWALFILFACGAPSGTLERLQLRDLFSYDKPIHAFLFGMLAWLIIQASSNSQQSLKKRVTQAALISAAYGVLIEILQKFYFEGRSYDYFDMLANCLGCLIVWVWQYRRCKQFAQ